MSHDKLNDDINRLFEEEEWLKARKLLEKALKKEPTDHWLLAQLGTTYYEERDYEKALELAREARKIVPDCPLAMWGEAGALQMLDGNQEAKNLYKELMEQGVALIQKYGLGKWDDDCWEGAGWTLSLLTDCFYRTGVCFQDMNKEDLAIGIFLRFIDLRTRREGGIYTIDDAKARLATITPVDPEDFSKKMEEEVAALS